MIESMIDIIIVNYNSTPHLMECLRSIYATLNGISARIIVQDNGSRDNVDIILKHYTKVELIKNYQNLGFSKAVNRAISMGDAPYVLILNPDTALQPGFFEPLLTYMDGNPDVGIAGTKILNQDGTIQGSARSFPTALTAFFGRSSALTKWFPNNRLTSRNILTTRSDGVHPMEVEWVSGACLMARRQAIEEVGLLDERFFMYWEDADWCRRMWKHGWRIVYFPSSGAVHYVGVSSEQLMTRSAFEFHKSSYRLFEKYNPISLWLFWPLIISGLLLRLGFVVNSNFLRVWLQRRRQPQAATDETDAHRGKIKIVRLIARLNIGGPAIHVHLLTEGVDPRKFDSLLVTGHISSQEGDMSYLFGTDNSKLIHLATLQRDINIVMDLMAFFQIMKILHREKPHIIHTHTAKAGSSARLAALLYNSFSDRRIATVHTFHGHVFRGYFSKTRSRMFVWIERMLAQVTDVIIAISNSQKRDLADTFHIAPEHKIQTIELGFDLNPFLQSATVRGKLRRSLGVGPETLLVGIIGRLVPIKNHRLFLRAAKRFLEQNPTVDVRFVIVGDGELREELQVFCRGLGLDGAVTFVGWIQNVPAVYADLDILALTSINEGTPVSIIEAMAASVPVIATDAGGVLDLLGPLAINPGFVPNGFRICERGILCSKNDIEGFTAGLEYLVAAGSTERSQRARRARYFVTEKFSQKRLLNDIENLYLKLTDRG